MNITDKKFTEFLCRLPPLLQSAIENAVESMGLHSSALDEDYLKILHELSPEINEKMKGVLEIRNQSRQELTFIFLNRKSEVFEFLNNCKEDIIIWEGDYYSEGDIDISSSKIVIINGNVKCNNIVVDDSYLFVNGMVKCNVLFGASGNDKITQITHSVNANAIVENGHYTLVEDEIDSKNIIMIHNKIESLKRIKSNLVYENNTKDQNKLSVEIADKEGYFDEYKFLTLIKSNQKYKLLN